MGQNSAEQGLGNAEERRIIPGGLLRGGDASWVLKSKLEMYGMAEQVPAEAWVGWGRQELMATLGRMCGPRADH
jgi:hypothetical protein